MRRQLIILLLTVAAGVAQWTPAVALPAPVCLKGKPDAPVQLEVYSDYECASCATFYLQTMQSVFKNYADTGKVCVIYRAFPLKVNKHALDAARYARAARTVSVELWAKVADILFRTQAKWSKDGNIDAVLAAALKPDEMGQVREAFPSESIYDAIGDDVDDAGEDGVNDVPSVVIIGKSAAEELAGALTYAQLKPHLDAALAQQ